MTANSNLTRILLIGDSHLQYSHSYFAKSSYDVIVKAIRGLKWIDYFNDNLSVSSLLLSSEIQSILISTKAVFFLVGINSIRITQAKQIVHEIKDIILRLKYTFPHLNYSGGITISLSFPCFKTSKRFSTKTSLSSNIHSFNRRLILLSKEIAFQTLDFHINHDDLAHDNMHLRSYSYHRLFRSIIFYFTKLFPHSTMNMSTIPLSITSAQSSPTTTSLPK